MAELEDYLALVRRLGAGGINRSENDLSSNLKSALASFGLHGIIDTGSGSNRFKRPDIALYAERDAADVAGAADVVVEAKKPEELAAYASLREALESDGLWRDKFVPYVAAHAQRISYFVLTTFERFLIVPVPEALRKAAQESLWDADAAKGARIGRTVKPWRNKRTGYLEVSLWRRNQDLRTTVHRLVAAAFLGAPPSPKHVVAHNDGSRDNNHWLNLRWATQRANMADTVVHGTHNRGSRNGQAKIDEVCAVAIRRMVAMQVPREVAAEGFGLCRQAVDDIINRRRWGHTR